MHSGGIPKWLKGTDCKSVGNAFDGSNPSLSTSILLFEMIDGVKRGHRSAEAGVAQLARALAFQAKGRGFESRFPLHISARSAAERGETLLRGQRRPGSSVGRARPW